MEEEGGFNLYAMVFNDPVNAYDAFGLQGKGGKPKPPPHPPGEWKPGRENCCAYAYDRPGKEIHPGDLGGYKPKYPPVGGNYNCDDLKKRVKADFPNDPNVGPPKGGKCPDGYHKVKLWVDKGGYGFHFTRENDDGTWSDMPFSKPPGKCKPNSSNEDNVKPCKDGDICVPNRSQP